MSSATQESYSRGFVCLFVVMWEGDSHTTQTKKHVHLHCSILSQGINWPHYWYALPYLGSWHGICVFCLPSLSTAWPKLYPKAPQVPQRSQRVLSKISTTAQKHFLNTMTTSGWFTVSLDHTTLFEVTFLFGERRFLAVAVIKSKNHMKIKEEQEMRVAVSRLIPRRVKGSSA